MLVVIKIERAFLLSLFFFEYSLIIHRLTSVDGMIRGMISLILIEIVRSNAVDCLLCRGDASCCVRRLLLGGRMLLL